MTVVTMIGVVVFTGSSATAGPYTGTVDTRVKVKHRPAFSDKPAKVKVVIQTAGNVRPRGWITIIVRRAGKIVHSKVVDYSGDNEVYTIGTLSKGKYSVALKFDPKGANSVLQDSKTKFTLRVS